MAHMEKVEHGSGKRGLHKLEENGKTRKTDKDICVPETTADSETKITEMDNDVIDKTNLKGRIFCVTSEKVMENRKVNALNAKNKTDLQYSLKDSKSVLIKTSERIISNRVIQTDVDFDSGIDINPSSQSEHENVKLTGYRSEVECHSENLDVQKLNYFENKSLLISEQNNKDESHKALDSNLSNNNFKFSIDYILAIPGPSNSCESIPLSNFPGQNIEDKPLSIEQTPNERKDSSMSLSCKKKAISGNIEVLEGKDLYASSQREYKSVEEECRPRHIYSHEEKLTCDVCEKTFDSFIELEDHYFDHENHHSTYCRVCQKEIDEHQEKNKWKGKFKCCYKDCGFVSTRRSSFKQHLYTHSIFRLFKCELCGKRYFTEGTLWKHCQTHA